MRKGQEMNLTPKEVCNYAKWLERIDKEEEGAAQIKTFFHLNPQFTKDGAMLACLAPLADKWGAKIGAEF
jgi:hypothetical protein